MDPLQYCDLINDKSRGFGDRLQTDWKSWKLDIEWVVAKHFCLGGRDKIWRRYWMVKLTKSINHDLWIRAGNNRKHDSLQFTRTPACTSFSQLFTIRCVRTRHSFHSFTGFNELSASTAITTIRFRLEHCSSRSIWQTPVRTWQIWSFDYIVFLTISSYCSNLAGSGGWRYRHIFTPSSFCFIVWW